MKNFILLIAVALFSSPLLASDCASGTCRAPLKRVATKVVDVTTAVVSAPVRVVKNTACTVKNRRYSRRCCR